MDELQEKGKGPYGATRLGPGKSTGSTEPASATDSPFLLGTVTSTKAFGQVVESGNFAAAGKRRDLSVGPKAPLQLESYGARLCDDEPRLSRGDPGGGHDIAVVGRSVK